MSLDLRFVLVAPVEDVSGVHHHAGIKGVTITTGLVDTYSTPTLLELIRSGQLDVGGFVTHRFTFESFLDAYDTFARAGETGALKVALTAT